MNAKAILGAALIVIAAGLAGGGLYVLHSLKQKAFDPGTLCPLDGSKSVTLIIIDKTDPLTEPEQARIRRLVSDERDATPRGGRLTVRLLRQKESTNETVLDIAADLCNPGAEANPLFENPKRVAARYQSAFRGPIEEALASVAGAGSAPASPIARSIHAAMEAAPASPGQQIKLIVVSDLMEHTGEASAYAGTLSEKALRMAIAQSSADRLKGAEIQVLLLARSRYAKQQEAAIAVWRRFFRAVAGREPDLIRL